MKILLDCGHCLTGSDTGAQGNGRKEQDCTREIGYKVKAKLEALGHTVIVCWCDSSSSVNESLAFRTNTANKAGGDLYIAIHLNAGGGYGTEIFTFGAKHFAEADRVLSEIVALGFNNRGIKDGSGLYVIRNSSMKSMLVECCFMDTNDMAKYNAENFANAIVKGVTGQSIIAPVKPTAPITTPATTGYKTVNASVLNVRSGQGANFTIVGQLKLGDKVKIDKNFSTGWTSIYFGQHGGFVSTQYLK